jgi:endoglucanase
MPQRNSILLTLCITGAVATQSPLSRAADIPYRGVNFSGGEFGGCTKEAKYGFKYLYPRSSDIDYFMALGMNTFRVPFCWERLQKAALQQLDPAELARLDPTIQYATAKGAYIVLDPHNYGLYWGKKINTDDGRAAFADFWRRLAAQYRGNKRVIFGLMNEPQGISSENWLLAANAAIEAIRSGGANNLILVPGTAWTGAHSWTASYYGTPNAVSMLKINDPQNNYAYEVHQYFDRDSSGTSADCVSEEIGAKRIVALNTWLQTNRKKAFLGEFGGAKSDTCYAATYNLLSAIHQNPTLWIGWTYWSAGPWLGNYMFALPLQPTDGPSQLDVLKKFLTGAAHCSGADCSPPNAPILQNQ